ncbi:MAG: hypothetical protein PHS80_09215 [Methanothrix sp.]|jgi:hypothetical protein|nr:hypothetical protein [Methanothrix sp.]MDD4447114.1 hypothetical protein [Methanothrix sp.]
MATSLLEGKVAKIKNQYQIVINKGTEHGVENGMHFVIYEIGEELTDPDTGNSLGPIEYAKAKVRVTYAKEKYAIAETYETENSRLLGLTLLTGERKKLPLSDDDRSRLPGRDDSSLTVKEGDLVRQIID